MAKAKPGGGDDLVRSCRKRGRTASSRRQSTRDEFHTGHEAAKKRVSEIYAILGAAKEKAEKK